MSGLDENGQPRNGADTPLNKDVEIFNPSSDLDGRGTVTLAGRSGHSLKGMYPHMFVMPSGRTLIAGPYQVDSFYLSVGSTSYTTASVPNLLSERYWGTAVLMPGGTGGSKTVMATGGVLARRKLRGAQQHGDLHGGRLGLDLGLVHEDRSCPPQHGPAARRLHGVHRGRLRLGQRRPVGRRQPA
jgi:hypothetical protein